MSSVLNLNRGLVLAITKRDLRSYFMNPSGYVFLTLFIFLSAAAAFWSESFFQNNLANLDQLNKYFPFLLLFFIPALTMSVWAEERKQGTDELLLTLPATDLEITLGKYLALVGVYSASLLLSLSHVIVLAFLGSPDVGLMFGNYVGYWLIGAALLSVGMLASMLTKNITVAFVLGAVFSSFFIFIDSPQAAFTEVFGKSISALGMFTHFRDFSQGVISLTGILYFLSIVIVALYLNVAILGARHWKARQVKFGMASHYTVRALALLIAALSLNSIVAHAALRLDVTSEGLHSLSERTEALLSELSDDRPVLIQAFISPNPPKEFVETKANLLSFLTEIDALAGDKVQVLIHETEQYTQEARDARDKFGINSRGALTVSGQTGEAQVYMGVAFTCGAREDVIPFFERGLPVEYSLTRSIRTVAQTDRKKIGVMTTEAKVFGGFDFQTYRSSPPWPVVEELRKQYEVTQVSSKEPITEELDGLLVALPSSLTQPEMDNLKTYIQAGNPTMLLVDPVPTFDIALSPALPRGSGGNPFTRNQQPQEDPKGNVMQLMAELGVQWNVGASLWDAYNPHPDLAHLPLEIVFVGRGNKAPEPFNDTHPASSGLQELALLYPGMIQKSPQAAVDFVPLVTSGPSSGSHSFQQLIQRGFFGMSINRNPRRVSDPLSYTLAAHIRGLPADSLSDTTLSKLNMMVIADLDFISQQFFQIRNMGIQNLNFDNITFFLNGIDILVGDSSFIDLRKKRVTHRTLTTVEAQTRSFYEARIAGEKNAESEAGAALAEAQSRLNAKVAEVTSRIDLDQQTKQIMSQNLQEVENRRFEQIKLTIEAQKEAQIQRSKENMELEIKTIQSRIKTLAVAIPPAPALLFGLFVFIRRRKRERESIIEARRMRG